MGMVTTPVATTLATALPEIEPMSPEPTTATLAGPPRMRPRPNSARSVKNAEPPVALSTWPKKTKTMTIVVATASGEPSTPLMSSAR